MPVPVIDIIMSERLKNALLKSGIDTLEKARDAGERIASLPNIGKSSLVELKTLFHAYDLDAIDNQFTADIRQLEMSVRLKNCLLRAGLNTLEKASVAGEPAWRKIPSFGEACISELRMLIVTYGCGRAENNQSDKEDLDPAITAFASISKKLKAALHRFGVFRLSELLEVDSELFSKSYFVSEEMLSELLQHQATPPSLPDDVRLALISNIELFDGFSNKLKNSLRKIGVNSLNEALCQDPDQFKRVQSVGLATALELAEYQRCIPSLTRGTANRVVATQELTMIPATVSSNKEFVENCREAFDQFCASLDIRERLIATSRIWPLRPEDGKTLEAIGVTQGVTRERIRQIEIKLLAKFARFFCHGSVMPASKRGPLLKLAPELSERWMDATGQLESMDEIDAFGFIKILENSFSIRRIDLVEILDFAVSLYSQGQSSGLRSELRSIGFNIFALPDLSPAILDIKIDTLRLGRASKSLNELYGIVTLEDVWKSASGLSPYHSMLIDEALENLHKSVTAGGHLNWSKFCRLNGFESRLGYGALQTERSASQFLAELRFVAECVATWSHSLRIFDERLSKPTSERRTQQSLATELLGRSAVAPQIARLEKYVIDKLADVVVYHDFSFCNCYVEDTVLLGIEKAKRFKKKYAKFEEFESSIKSMFDDWNSSNSGLPHLMWALLEGNAPNRYYHLYKKNKSEDTVLPEVKKIKLKGFRRVF